VTALPMPVNHSRRHNLSNPKLVANLSNRKRVTNLSNPQPATSLSNHRLRTYSS